MSGKRFGGQWRHEVAEACRELYARPYGRFYEKNDVRLIT
jgi:hypothetical protein